MTIKKKIAMCFAFVICMISAVMVKVNAYDITEVGYIWEYLEKDDFVTGTIRAFGWFIYQTVGMFLNLCYDTFTSIAKWDILDLPIVGQIITNLDLLMPYILVITLIVVAVIRVLDFQNMIKIIGNVLIVAALLATFSRVLVLVDDLKNVGLEEAANVVGVEDYKMTEVLLAENTVDIKKSLDSGSVQKLDVADVEYFQHNLRLDKDDLDEDIVRQNEDGSYETVGLSDGFFGIGDVHFFRYRTDYWSLNISMLVSVIVYIMASFKMAYLLSQWLQENIFGGLLIVKGIWDYRSVGKIFKSILSTVFAQIEVYFMMLFFSYFCSSVISGETLTNWMAKAIVIFAMGMMIISGSGFINNALGIDDGSNFMLRSMIISRRLGHAVRAPMRAVSGVAGVVASHVGSGVKAVAGDSRMKDLLSSFHQSQSNNGQLPNNGQPPKPTDKMSEGNRDAQYQSDGSVSQTAQSPSGRNVPPNMLTQPYHYQTNTDDTGNVASSDHDSDESGNQISADMTSNDYVNDLKEKYNETLNQENKEVEKDVKENSRLPINNDNHLNMIKRNSSGTVSNNPDHVKKMEMISKGYTETKVQHSTGNQNNRLYPTADEQEDMINSLNEWDIEDRQKSK